MRILVFNLTNGKRTKKKVYSTGEMRAAADDYLAREEAKRAARVLKSNNDLFLSASAVAQQLRSVGVSCSIEFDNEAEVNDDATG
jgi:hypothetical protein